MLLITLAALGAGASGGDGSRRSGPAALVQVGCDTSCGRTASSSSCSAFCCAPSTAFRDDGPDLFDDKGWPGNTTETIAISLWRKAFEGFTMGWSSALAVILLLTAIAFTSVYLYVFNVSQKGGLEMRGGFRQTLYRIVLWLVAIVFFLPVLWIIFGALKTKDELLAMPPVDFIPTLANFVDPFSRPNVTHT